MEMKRPPAGRQSGIIPSRHAPEGAGALRAAGPGEEEAIIGAPLGRGLYTQGRGRG
ncbi:hypothetical protein APY03_4782 [Variovorax sp. WDL1]|nr:hypothetical protein APY03_4782 [Variovorax sp. WDL1]